jgi:hypothetical protein
MPLIDLSQDIYEGMKVYPGHLKTVQFEHGFSRFFRRSSSEAPPRTAEVGAGRVGGLRSRCQPWRQR